MELPDFITQHLDPFSGDDNTSDIDGSTGSAFQTMTPLNIPTPDFPEGTNGDAAQAPLNRNSPCPCGSGKKFKHCHGQLA